MQVVIAFVIGVVVAAIVLFSCKDIGPSNYLAIPAGMIAMAVSLWLMEGFIKEKENGKT